MTEIQSLINEFSLNNLQITEKQSEKLIKYKNFLLEWNQNINLISKKTIEEFNFIHLIDSALPIIHIPKHNPIIDLGTGGGLPGIVYKILYPNIKITLAETKTKKLNFLNNCIENLNLNGIDIFNPAQNKPEKKYKLLISRAFGDLTKIIQESKKYLIKDSFIAAYKGKETIIKSELEKIKHLYESKIIPYTLVTNNETIDRNLVLLKKRQ